MVIFVYLPLAVLVMLPGLLVPEWLGTEARRVEVALEMLRSGDWLRPTLGFEPYLSKPPLHTWMLAVLADWLGPERPWMRLPGVVGVAVLAAASHACVRRFHGRAAAWVAGLGLLCAPVTLGHCAKAEIDPVFAAATAGSLIVCASGAARRNGWLLVVGGALGGAAILVKGPPYLMFFAGTALVWLRRLRGRGLWLAVLPMLALPAAYYLPLWLAGAHVGDVAVAESVARLGTFEWRHVIDTPLYVGRVLLLSLPFGPLLFYEYRGARRAEPDAAETFLRMCAAGAFSAVLILLIFPARPWRYLLPAAPLFIVAISPSIVAFAAGARPLGSRARQWIRAAGLVGCAALVALPWLPRPFVAAGGWAGVMLATAPLWIGGRRTLVAAGLAVPALLAALAMPWVLTYRQRARIPYSAAGRSLRAELEARQAGDLGWVLHPPSALFLEAGILPPGSETGERPPATRWILMEAGARPAPGDDDDHPDAHPAATAAPTHPPPGWQLRVALQTPRRIYWLLERR